MSLCLCLYLFVVLVTFGVIVEGRSLRVSGDTINPMTLKSGDNLEIVVDNNVEIGDLLFFCENGVSALQLGHFSISILSGSIEKDAIQFACDVGVDVFQFSTFSNAMDGRMLRVGSVVSITNKLIISYNNNARLKSLIFPHLSICGDMLFTIGNLPQGAGVSCKLNQSTSEVVPPFSLHICALNYVTLHADYFPKVGTHC
eukprot:m.35215 g.35215  ORF g.35215 m.35215 type:complete len:200 (-) comp9994_c0_seq2:215-814(-)